MKEIKQKSYRVLIALVTIILTASITLQIRTMKKASSEIYFAFVNDLLTYSFVSHSE